MEVIVHDPKSQNAQEELQINAAKIYADFILDYINRLPYPVEQKCALMKSVCEQCARLIVTP
ncbi:MAG: hypothetical protein K0S76_1304 [Herbinix sp.]|nr:hypothetical protein [Herbinix sp.]